VTYALTDLTSGGHIGRDENDVMVSASLAKVPVLVALYQAVHEERLALDQRVTYQPQHRSFGSGVLARLSPGVEMSLRDAATLMIIISDNSATNIVVDAVGLDYVNEQMRRLGFKDTILFRRWEFEADTTPRETWVSTARETAALLALIARHEAVSPEASQDMLRIMRRQDYRHELSRNLPWTEMNTLPDHEQNWVAEKGGASPGGIRCGGSIFHSARGSFVMAAFCEGGTAGGTGREAEGNVLLGALGYEAWAALAAPVDPA
jgi:beta-lactamase class A